MYHEFIKAQTSTHPREPSVPFVYRTGKGGVSLKDTDTHTRDQMQELPPLPSPLLSSMFMHHRCFFQ